MFFACIERGEHNTIQSSGKYQFPLFSLFWYHYIATALFSHQPLKHPKYTSRQKRFVRSRHYKENNATTGSFMGLVKVIYESLSYKVYLDNWMENQLLPNSAESNEFQWVHNGT